MKGNNIGRCIKCTIGDGLLHRLEVIPPSYSVVLRSLLYCLAEEMCLFGHCFLRVRKWRSVGKNSKESNQNNYACFIAKILMPIFCCQSSMLYFFLNKWFKLFSYVQLTILKVQHLARFNCCTSFFFNSFFFYISHGNFKFEFFLALSKCPYFLIIVVDVQDTSKEL